MPNSRPNSASTLIGLLLEQYKQLPNWLQNIVSGSEILALRQEAGLRWNQLEERYSHELGKRRGKRFAKKLQQAESKNDNVKLRGNEIWDFIGAFGLTFDQLEEVYEKAERGIGATGGLIFYTKASPMAVKWFDEWRTLLSRTSRNGLRDLRVEKGLTQAQLAKLTGLSRACIYQMEKGIIRGWTSEEQWRKLSLVMRALGKEPSEMEIGDLFELVIQRSRQP
jgi:DNA-binding XRE family transcriptional regulator